MPVLPLVGREAELALLFGVLDAGAAGRGRTLLLCGESGQGKSRLARAAADEAGRRGWSVAVGRGYPVESGVPYAPISDALLPLLRGLGDEALAVLTRGAEAELLSLFPALRPAAPLPATADPAELRARVLWNFSQLLGRLAARRPLLLVIEDLQWADPSSLEALHFVARQIGGERIVLLCTYNDAGREENATLRRTEQSLVSLDAAEVHRVEPLSRADTDRLVREAFAADEAATREFTALLFGWTRGNPFFIEETLKALVRSGRLRQEGGRWRGWEIEELQLPTSIRELVRERVDRLSGRARALANLHAVIGTGARYETLAEISALEEAEFVEALDELCRAQVVVERASGPDLVYDFSHPLLRETLLGELGMARARLLHAGVAESLERHYGDRAPEHADELAFHFSRAGAARLAPKATRYLSAAGRNALHRYAYREAVDYLQAALALAEETEGGPEPQLLRDLARARHRVGDFDAAIALWARLREDAFRRGDHAGLAVAERRLGLAHQWSGQARRALEHFDAAARAAAEAGDAEIRARVLLSRGQALLEVAQPSAAAEALDEARSLAEARDDLPLLSRIHRTLLLLHTWTGPPAKAQEHGARALALSERTGDLGLACTAHWALAAMAGLTGHLDTMKGHIRAGEELAERIRSPLHQIWIAEIALEHLAATGEWEAAIALGERTIAKARGFHQRTLLPRLLVWTSLLLLARGDTERGRRYVDEAWALVHAGGDDHPLDVHTAVPAYTGRLAYHMAVDEFDEAVRVGEAGLAIADRSGYTVWAIHRLLPMLAEAYLFRSDHEGAARAAARLRTDSERMGHRAGLAWADAADAILVWAGGDLTRSVAMLRDAAEQLESISLVPYAARIRRQYAARLRDAGDHDGALAQLRRIHDVFVRLGAERELQKTREQIRELGARPPAREAAVGGAAGLTPREVEIVRLVANRKTNKSIGLALDISARTVSTHLSHIFRKLNVASRGELAEVARTMQLPE